MSQGTQIDLLTRKVAALEHQLATGPNVTVLQHCAVAYKFSFDLDEKLALDLPNEINTDVILVIFNKYTGEVLDNPWALLQREGQHVSWPSLQGLRAVIIF